MDPSGECYLVPLGANCSSFCDVGPKITSVSPARGPVGFTTDITISGAGFGAGSSVQVSGSGVTISDVTVVSSSQITAKFAVAVNAEGGSRAVTVTHSSMTSNSDKTFYIQTPSKLLRFDYQPPPPARQAPNGVSQLYVITNGDVIDLFGTVLASNRCGAYRNLMYQLVDQAGVRI
ncbi:MAG: IPT/TIG domain-containing protein [Blastocatellales bacterium]|nr:IPT/TIG domain-containing protein [Blastocatellales bacterium]